MKPEQPMSIVDFTRQILPSEITQFRMLPTGSVSYTESWSSRGMPNVFREALLDGGFRFCYELREDRMVFDEKRFLTLLHHKIDDQLRGWIFEDESKILANLLSVDLKDVTHDDLWAASYKYSASKEQNDRKRTAKLAILMAAHRRAGCSNRESA